MPKQSGSHHGVPTFEVRPIPWQIMQVPLLYKVSKHQGALDFHRITLKCWAWHPGWIWITVIQSFEKSHHIQDSSYPTSSTETSQSYWQASTSSCTGTSNGTHHFIILLMFQKNRSTTYIKWTTSRWWDILVCQLCMQLVKWTFVGWCFLLLLVVQGCITPNTIHDWKPNLVGKGWFVKAFACQTDTSDTVWIKVVCNWDD